MRFVAPLLAALALALFAVFLGVSLPDAMDRADDALDRAERYSGETVREERNRFWGEGFTQSIEKIRGVIPPDGAYVLVNGDEPDHGAPIWIRYELAPRRAILLKLGDLYHPRRVRQRIPRSADWVVVATEGRAPELIDKASFLRHLRDRD